MNKTQTIALFASGLLLGLAAPTEAHAIVLKDPPLVTGADAIDPVSGPNAGRQNVTLIAPGGPTKEKLLAVPDFAVIQSFEGFEGAVSSPVNSVEFTNGHPSVKMTINKNTRFSGCGSTANETNGYTSGPLNSAETVSIFIGNNLSSTIYTMDFSAPVAAVGFTIIRPEATSTSSIWTVSYYGQDGKLVDRQVAKPADTGSIAVLFGHIAKPDGLISRVVIGKDGPTTTFAMGSTSIYLDDLGYARAPTRALQGGLISNPVVGIAIGGVGGETIDIQASGASPQGFLERIDGFSVVQDWKGFKGITANGRDTINTIDFPQGLDFLFRLQVQGDGADGCGGLTTEPAYVTSPKQALLMGGGGGRRRLEIVAGLHDTNTSRFQGDATLYAAGFAVTNRGAGDLIVTFYNLAGDILSVQSGAGMLDPANRENPSELQGAEIYFGYIATSPTDSSRWIHRIRIEDQAGGPWGLDDFGFATSP